MDEILLIAAVGLVLAVMVAEYVAASPIVSRRFHWKAILGPLTLFGALFSLVLMLHDDFPSFSSFLIAWLVIIVSVPMHKYSENAIAALLISSTVVILTTWELWGATAHVTLPIDFLFRR